MCALTITAQDVSHPNCANNIPALNHSVEPVLMNIVHSVEGRLLVRWCGDIGAWICVDSWVRTNGVNNYGIFTNLNTLTISMCCHHTSFPWQVCSHPTSPAHSLSGLQELMDDLLLQITHRTKGYAAINSQENILKACHLHVAGRYTKSTMLLWNGTSVLKVLFSCEDMKGKVEDFFSVQ